jgi:hypothetical protein
LTKTYYESIVAPPVTAIKERTMQAQITTTHEYLQAWNRKDLAAIEGLIADGVAFRGPMAETTGRQAFTNAVAKMFPLLQRIDVRHVYGDADHTVAVYDFVCAPPIGKCRTTELLRFESGRICASELFFDARPFEALMRASARQP